MRGSTMSIGPTLAPARRATRRGDRLTRMSDERRTDSGIELQPVYTADDLARRGFDPASDLGEPGELPVHARHLPHDVSRPAVDDAPVRRHGHRRRDEPRGSATCSTRGRPGCRSRSTCRPRWAWTPTTRARRARSGKTGVAIDSCDDMERLFDAHPARPRVDLDDDQRHRRRSCCCSTSWWPRSRASTPRRSAARCRTTS